MIEAIRKVKKVIISGGVAVGKSSIIESLTNYLKEHNHKYIHIPEYIDVKPDALDMLNKYLTKQISAFEFQEYVTNFYNEYLSTLKINGDEILIFERGPDDGITCFSNLDYNKDNITEQEFFKLYNLALSYDKKFNLPSYFNDDDKIFIPIKTQDAERDGNIIGSIITNRNNNNIIIGLYNSNDICY